MNRVAVALVALVGLAACREREVGLDARVVTADKPQASRILYPSAPGSFVDLVANARHGVVAIRAAAPVKSGPAAMFPGAPESAPDVALGTGFLVQAHGVFVVTNDHIAAGSADLKVVLADGTEVAAKLVGRDLRLDLALLSVDRHSAPPSGGAAQSGEAGPIGVPRLQPLPLGDSDDLHVGEWLVVLGNPFGDEVSASAGIVSATGREAAGSLVPGRAMGFRTFLQTDARIHRGNSGGPVLDTAGQVVGIAVATGDRLGETSFAVPINRVREVIDALRDHGQVARGWLGALVKPVTADLAQSLALPTASGALITEVKPASPAARAGIRAGDVVLRWGDKDIDHRSLPWIVAATPINRPTNVVVWRNRAELVVPVVTDKMPE